MSVHHDDASSYSTPDRSFSTTQILIAGLVLVSMIAILGPLAVYFGTRSTEDAAPLIVGVNSPSTVPTLIEPTATATTPATPEAVATAPAAATQVGTTTTNGSGSAPAVVVTQLAGESASTFKVIGIPAGSSLNVRQAAGTNNPLIGTLPANATGVASTGRRVSVDGAIWREITFNNSTGWVFGGYLAAAPAPAATAVPAATATAVPVTQLAADTPATYQVTGLAVGSSLNVRSEPGATNRLLGTLPSNATGITSTGRRALVGQTEWREVNFRTSTGWVDSSYLKLVPSVPQTVLLPTVAPSTIGIVPLTSSADRLALRVDPGYDKTITGTVGASTMNVTATGRRAKIGTESWIEISVLGATGWVPAQLTTTSVTPAKEVIATSGVVAVTIDKVETAQDGTVTLTVGDQTIKVPAGTIVASGNGSKASVENWATAGKVGGAELTVSGNLVVYMWVK